MKRIHSKWIYLEYGGLSMDKRTFQTKFATLSSQNGIDKYRGSMSDCEGGRTFRVLLHVSKQPHWDAESSKIRFRLTGGQYPLPEIQCPSERGTAKRFVIGHTNQINKAPASMRFTHRSLEQHHDTGLEVYQPGDGDDGVEIDRIFQDFAYLMPDGLNGVESNDTF